MISLFLAPISEYNGQEDSASRVASDLVGTNMGLTRNFAIPKTKPMDEVNTVHGIQFMQRLFS